MSADPQRIGPYTIIRRLGEGGMGIVYLARRDAESRLVAVKTLRPGLVADADFQRRFTREIEAARSVARFCTAPVLDAGIDGDTAFLVTEYVDGPDLAAAIKNGGPMAGADLEALAVGVATALTAIHQAGVVHRDLKPANILLSAVGPRVIDFGIARIVEPDSTRSVEIVGTPAFMSPEQAHGDPVTAASDVFAWGGVVTYAATGRAPFGTGGAPEVLFRVVHYVPDLTGLDERLRPLVEQALAKEPGRRPTAQQILDRLLGRESITMSVASHAVSDSWMARRLRADRDTVPSRQPGNGRQWTRPAAMIGAALAVALAGTGTALWRPWEAAPSTTPTVTSPVPTTPVPTTPAPTAPVLAKADAVTTNIDGVRVPIHITIDALKRTPDDTVRLEWTVRNDSKDGAQAHLWTLIRPQAEGVQDIVLTYDRSKKSLHPLVLDDWCYCSTWFGAGRNSIDAGESLLFVAEFSGVPRGARKADVDLQLLGHFTEIPIT
ncbi:serine/threonine-protein kinase [Nonomuraea polychroma]|uniref:serine/threonine-protein kinase n=1 Tax=Nonomuraea polychroma TaxID=46176 RepID=UPI0019D4B5B0|nr:serine/threonine-protein kinase [Nonomuraea polychroma]